MRHGGNVWTGGDPCRWLDFSANLRPECLSDWVTEALHAAVADARYDPDRRMTAARRGRTACLGMPEKNILLTAGGAAAHR